MNLRPALLGLAILTLAAPAQAQLFGLLNRKPAPVGPPPGTPPAEAEIWPYPAPDPQSWWDEKRLAAEEAADPLGGRRIRRGERLPAVDSGVEASTYRLWGLMPLQWQLLRGDEMILEVWSRPTASVRQTVTRVVVKGDEVFVQARAGLACCEAGIGRRVGLDAKLPAGSADRFRALRGQPMWNSPRDAIALEPGSAAGVCVEGSSYDLTLLVAGGSRTIRRACDLAEVGEAADALEAVIGAALGHEPRFDVVFRGSADFSAARRAYQGLIAAGGALKPDPDARPQPPGLEPLPQAEPDTPMGSSIPNP